MMIEAEASPAEIAPLCLTKQSLSDTQTYAELPSSTTLGRPRSPVASPEQRSGVRRRSQGGPPYIRSKIKVRKQADRAKDWWCLSGEHFFVDFVDIKLNILSNNDFILQLNSFRVHSLHHR